MKTRKLVTVLVIALLAVAGTFATGCDLLKDLEYRPTKQSKASKKAKQEFEWRKYDKKR